MIVKGLFVEPLSVIFIGGHSGRARESLPLLIVNCVHEMTIAWYNWKGFWYYSMYLDRKFCGV